MERNNIMNKILGIISSELSIEGIKCEEIDTFSAQGIDSIGFMAMIIFIEEAYQIEFEFDGLFLSEFSSIRFSDLIDEILKLIESK